MEEKEKSSTGNSEEVLVTEEKQDIVLSEETKQLMEQTPTLEEKDGQPKAKKIKFSVKFK